MTTPAANRHIQLENILVSGRMNHTLPSGAERGLLVEMGDLWWEMTDEEQEEANARAEVNLQLLAKNAAPPMFYPAASSETEPLITKLIPREFVGKTPSSGVLIPTSSANQREYCYV